MKLFIIFSYFLLNVNWLCSNVSYFILDITNLCFLYFSPLIVLSKGLSILLMFSRNQLLVWFIYSITHSFSISLISGIIFIVSFFLLCLDLACCFYFLPFWERSLNYWFSVLIVFNICIKVSKFSSEHCFSSMPQLLIHHVIIFQMKMFASFY